MFWVKLRQRGYTRSIAGLYRFLRKSGQMAAKLPNPKYVPKPYEQMKYPGQRVQIDVKYVPKACLVGDAVREAAENGGYFYQYTFIDEYSRFRYLEAFQEHNSFSPSEFIKHCAKRFPYAIECVQTDNGPEFTNRLISPKDYKPTLFENTLEDLCIQHKLIKPYTPLALWQRQYNDFPVRPLNWRSPKDVLSAFPNVIQTNSELPIRRQCELLGVTRSTVYYEPKPEDEEAR